MGRTLATFSMNVDQTCLEWSKFKRALRREDQEIFETLFSNARFHAQAGAYLSPIDPFPVMLLCMLLEERKARITLEKRIRELEDSFSQ
ncbi:MAG: hypothetical protein ACYCYP_05830 [Leptospirales bacterium]